MSTILTCASSGDQWAAGGTVLYLEIKMKKTAGTSKFTKHFATDLIHKYIKGNLNIYTCLDLAHYYR